MKKLVFVFLIAMVFSLTACTAKAEPLSGIEISKYELLYEDRFEIYILKEIPEIHYPIWLPLEELENETCILSYTSPNVYIVKYKGDYISLKNGIDLNLFDTYDLITYGIVFECFENE